MSREHWAALSARIRGLVGAAELDARYRAIRAHDSFGRMEHLEDQARRIHSEIKRYRTAFAHTLPSAAVVILGECLDEDVGPLLALPTMNSLSEEKLWALVVMLQAFDGEMTYILSDAQAAIRARSERAFAHLQRLIVVDAAFRKQWKAAYKKGEVECERRGSVHLLLHGIWAFKVSAAGERTDLVLPNAKNGLLDEQQYADGLVLTEWKCASSRRPAQKWFEDARRQAGRYAQGVLAGTELAGFRYAVVVSEGHLEVPDDVQDGDVIYRHINIAVAPETPSKTPGPKRTTRNQAS